MGISSRHDGLMKERVTPKKDSEKIQLLTTLVGNLKVRDRLCRILVGLIEKVRSSF